MTVWGANLILTADLAYHVNCATLGHLLMAHHCNLCLNVCFSSHTAPRPPHPSAPYRLMIINPSKKLPQKPGAFK